MLGECQPFGFQLIHRRQSQRGDAVIFARRSFRRFNQVGFKIFLIGHAFKQRINRAFIDLNDLADPLDQLVAVDIVLADDDHDNQVKHAFSRVGQTLKKIRQKPVILYFIIAYFCYIDGVYTIISMATTYGGEVGISDTSMILALLLTQFVAFPCAIFAGRLAEKIGTLKVIRISILIYCGICVFGYQLDQSWEFWVLAVIVGMAQGGIQSLSRSFYGRIIPKEESNEYFGFFDIFGKFADFFGPLIMSFCALALGSSTYGILALLVLFIIGYVLLRKVPEVK